MALNKFWSQLRLEVLKDFENKLSQKEIAVKHDIHKSMIKSRNIKTRHKSGWSPFKFEESSMVGRD